MKVNFMFHVVLNQCDFLSVDHKSRNLEKFAGKYFHGIVIKWD